MKEIVAEALIEPKERNLFEGLSEKNKTIRKVEKRARSAVKSLRSSKSDDWLVIPLFSLGTLFSWNSLFLLLPLSLSHSHRLEGLSTYQRVSTCTCFVKMTWKFEKRVLYGIEHIVLHVMYCAMKEKRWRTSIQKQNFYEQNRKKRNDHSYLIFRSSRWCCILEYWEVLFFIFFIARASCLAT